MRLHANGQVHDDIDLDDMDFDEGTQRTPHFFYLTSSKFPSSSNQ